MKKSKNDAERAKKRYGNESDVESLTGIARRTLQKHRLLGRGFPFYRVNGRILYDLDEVESIIRSTRAGGGQAA
jgi:hypothetical protein